MEGGAQRVCVMTSARKRMPHPAYRYLRALPQKPSRRFTEAPVLEVHAMADPVRLNRVEPTARRAHARVVAEARELADRIERLSDASLREAVPIAGWGVEEVSRRLRPWTQKIRPARSVTTRTGAIATVAAALATVGDLLLLRMATTSTSASAIESSSGAPTLLLGYYLGALAIPLYAVGYWRVSRSLPLAYRRAVVALGTCGAVVGGIIHAVTGVALHARSLAPTEMAGVNGVAVLGPFAAYLVPLWVLVAGMLLAGSILFAVPVLRGESSYPRWIGLVNPAVLVVVIAFAASASPWSRALIAPAAPNLAHVLFFLLTYRDAAMRDHA